MLLNQNVKRHHLSTSFRGHDSQTPVYSRSMSIQIPSWHPWSSKRFRLENRNVLFQTNLLGHPDAGDSLLCFENYYHSDSLSDKNHSWYWTNTHVGVSAYISSIESLWQPYGLDFPKHPLLWEWQDSERLSNLSGVIKLMEVKED